MTYEVKGTIKEIWPVEELGSKNTRKQTVIVEIAGKYPNVLPFDFWGKSQSLFEGLEIQVGDEVSVQFGLKGREWKGKYFVSLNAWDLSITKQPERFRKPASESVSEQGDFLNDDEDVPF